MDRVHEAVADDDENSDDGESDEEAAHPRRVSLTAAGAIGEASEKRRSSCILRSGSTAAPQKGVAI